MLKFSVGDYDGEEEYFLLAYHGLEEPVTEGRGLAIWHCIGNSMYDLESAIGLWDYDDAEAEEFFVPSTETLDENSVNGYDNYDYWKWPEGHRSWDEISLNHGTPYDFFGWDYVASEFARQHVFAPWTNPSCKGYDPSESTPIVRRRNQNQANSLIVKVTGYGTDSKGMYTVVDLLPGPCGEVVYPTGTLPLPQGVCQIQWTPEYGEYIESVDISYSNNGGITFPYTVATGVPADAEHTTYSWNVESGYATHSGVLKLVFHNTFGDEVHRGIAISEEFVVNGDYTVQEDLIVPNGGEVWYTGQDQEFRWTSYFNVNENIDADVDVEYRIGEVGDWLLLAEDVDYETVTPETGEPYNSTGIFTPYSLHGVAVWFRLHFTYQNPGGSSTETYEVSDGPVVIYPLEQQFSGATEGSGLEYLGRPYSTIALEASTTPGPKPDLFVTIEDAATGQPSSVLYRNDTQPGQTPRFFDMTEAMFVYNERPQIGSLGACAASLVEGQPDAIFVAHTVDNKARVYVFGNDPSNPGKYDNVANDAGWFGTDAQNLLFPSTCGTWCDIDHDYDLDLYVGRTGPNETVAPDALFENCGPNAATRFASRPANFFVSTATRTALWFNSQGAVTWSVLIGGTGSGFNPKLYRYKQSETNLWTFLPAATSMPGELTSTTALTAADLDRDNDMDIVVYRESGTVAELKNTVSGYRENELAIGQAGGTATVGDINADGFPDLVATQEGSSGVKMMLNFGDETQYGEGYHDYTVASGLDGQYGSAYSSLLPDLDRDGDVDLVVGREDSDGRLFDSSVPADPTLPARRWIRVNLGAESASNPGSIGAVVRLTGDGTAPLLGSQVVDGGSGRGSQQPRALVFGLGDYSGPVTVDVAWPGGHNWTSTVAAGVSGDVTVSPLLSIGLSPNKTPRFTLVVGPCGEIEWVFDWWVDSWTNMTLDAVEITAVSCPFTPICLGYSTSGVTVAVTPTISAGNMVYHHRLTWVGAPCYPSCTIQFRNYSGDNDGRSFQTEWYTAAMPKICPLCQ